MSRFRPSVMRSPQRAVERPYHDPIGQAMSHREPARYDVHMHPQDPHATATEIGAGDRALAEAQRRMLDPFNLEGRPDDTAAPASSLSGRKGTAAPTVAQPNFAALGAAHGAARMRADALAHAQQVAAQKEAERVRRAHTLVVPTSQAQRDAYRVEHPDWFEPSTPESGEQ